VSKVIAEAGSAPHIRVIEAHMPHFRYLEELHVLKRTLFIIERTLLKMLISLNRLKSSNIMEHFVV
jgi:hypothetical protein